MVAGGEIEGKIAFHGRQLSEKKTISIFPVLRDDISLDDGKGIPIPRYPLHDGLEYPPTLMEIGKDGEATLAEKQEPMVYADVHYGDPGTTSIKYECDFAPFKPRVDIIINGHAVSPTGKPVEEVIVALEIGSVRKLVRVIGERHWENRILGMRPSAPVPFLKMPLIFERAFGGSDHLHPNSKRHGTELRNPIGVGFHKNPDLKTIEKTSLPNLEDPRHPIQKWSDTPPPIGFGFIGRGWQPRIKYAGTYDDKWLEERFPFLPDDFDDQYFLSAPVDQQVHFLKGGETVRCINMTPEGKFQLTVPTMQIPIMFRFRDREERVEPNLDTLIIEPDERRCLVIWRATVPVGRKLTALREVLVGVQPILSSQMLTENPL